VKERKNLSLFEKIIEILFLEGNEVYFLMNRYKTTMFNPHFNAFCIDIEALEHALLFTVSSFAHFQPFSV